MKILAVDPGPVQTALCYFEDGVPEWVDTIPNEEAKRRISMHSSDHVVIEMIASYGMAVGAEVFETCVWIGRFLEAAHPTPVTRIPRGQIKLHLCQSMRAKDANVRQALIDKYGGKDVAIGKKKTAGPLYGVKGDGWAAVAVAVTFWEQQCLPS